MKYVDTKAETTIACVCVQWYVCVCVCVCVCAYVQCVCSWTHTLFISGKCGMQKQCGYPQMQKSLVKQCSGSMHAMIIGCPLALLESSNVSPVTGRKSYGVVWVECTQIWYEHIAMFHGDIVWIHTVNVGYDSCPQFRCQLSACPKTTYIRVSCVRACVCACMCVCQSMWMCDCLSRSVLLSP